MAVTRLPAARTPPIRSCRAPVRPSNDNCVEVAVRPEAIHMRDSKDKLITYLGVGQE
ncbi:DUF397 domain-containing protein [Streptomyces tailanensis]|uniref:DUF397 domain-containing protein n=1 Tax=Streptomyces tailanensis TaxID=2569858 RepID=UPI00319E771E